MTGHFAAPGASWRRSPSGRLPWRTGMTARGSSTCLRPTCAPATSWRSSPERSCPWTAPSVRGQAVLDEAALTGEPLPARRVAGEEIRSGASVVGEAIEVRALRPAAASTYARIVRLVEQAEADRPRTARLADRAAVVFLPITLLVAGAGWAISGSAVAALAVLVVATPCPLILATPIAFVSGLARAARRGIVIKGGTPLERLGAATVVVFDKTGTLTAGHPRVVEAADDLLALAAAAEAESAHPLAAAIRAEAGLRNLELAEAHDIREVVRGRGGGAGRGAARARRPGRLHRRSARPASGARRGRGVGRRRRRRRRSDRLLGPAPRRRGRRRRARPPGGRASGAADRRRRGSRRSTVGHATGIADIRAEASPEDKAAIVGALRREGEVVVMVGDGLNDAPALAAADVGVALGATGSTISSEAADAVMLVDDLGRVAEAIEIGRDTLRVARTGIVIGMGLSAVLMVIAALGGIQPLHGALAQEAIDVAAILNGLRALGGRDSSHARVAVARRPQLAAILSRVGRVAGWR